mgnify:CR=1 FL=1
MYALTSYLDGQLYYFRTLGGKELEVDFAMKVEGGVIAFEVKYREELSAKDVRPLLQFAEIISEARRVLLKGIIYAGEQIKALPGEVLALPWFVLESKGKKYVRPVLRICKSPLFSVPLRSYWYMSPPLYPDPICQLSWSLGSPNEGKQVRESCLL